jgi:uncharacterized protein (DUF1015 family)
MATITPFAALRPQPELAARICELPYDVMSSAEAREIARDNPLSFLRISKPEIELPEGVDPYAPEVYARGRENFTKLITQGSLRQDAAPGFYLYRQVMGTHQQTGLVAGASCAEYLSGVIKKHELTRPDKEDDRVRHIETLNAQTGPVFLVYRAQAALDEFVARKTATPPAVDFTAADGIRHTSWALFSAEDVELVQSAFRQLPCLYIADGHHRSAAAARVFQSRQGKGQSGFFLSVVFPHNQMQILPYNRALKDLNGLTAATLWERLRETFMVTSPGKAKPERKHDLGFFFEGQWHGLRFKPEHTACASAVERLDVAILQQRVLAPVFGIGDPRTSKRIQFIGGIRGTGELEKLVNRGEFACAFSMHPTSMEDLMEVADSGAIMPPKSTWFEPKLRDAMFCHLL